MKIINITLQENNKQPEASIVPSLWCVIYVQGTQVPELLNRGHRQASITQIRYMGKLLL